jgi:transcriptional regulator with XRE-family HTH domain
MSFSKRLCHAMIEKNISAKELAYLVGIKTTRLYGYTKQNGHLPPVDVAVKIASGLGLTVECLVTGKCENIARAEKHNDS